MSCEVLSWTMTEGLLLSSKCPADVNQIKSGVSGVLSFLEGQQLEGTSEDA